MVKVSQSQPSQLFVCGADWCGHCTDTLVNLAGVPPGQVEELKEKDFAKLPNGAIWVNCEAQGNSKFCDQLGIKGYPTVLQTRFVEREILAEKPKH